MAQAPTTPFDVEAIAEELRGSICVATDYIDNMVDASEAFVTIQNLVKAAQGRGLAQKYDAAEDSLKTVKGQGDDMRAFATVLAKAVQIANSCADSCDHLIANYEAAKKAVIEKAAKEAAEAAAAQKAAADKLAAEAAEAAAKKAAEAEELARQLVAAEKAAAEAQKTTVQVTNIGEPKKTTEYTFGFVKAGEQVILQTAVATGNAWTTPKLPSAKVNFYPENRCLIVSTTEGNIIYTVTFDATMNPMSGMATGTDGVPMMLEKKHSFVH